MADSDVVTLGFINFYCREKLWHHLQESCQNGLRKYGNDAVLKFFNAWGLVKEGSIQEGMRELEALKDKADVNLCTFMALIWSHKQEKNVDREAVQELESRLKEERRQAGEKGLYFAGLFLFHIGRHDKAREYVERVVKMNPQSREGLTLLGWNDMRAGRDAMAKKAGKYLEEALKLDSPKDPDLLMARAEYMTQRGKLSGALEVINHAVVTYPNFTPALVAKMRIQLASQDWEQVGETAARISGLDANNLHSTVYQILHLLCRDGNCNEATNKIGELVEKLDRFEPRNGDFYFRMAQVFSRICGRNNLVLQQTLEMVQRALSTDKQNAEYFNELGFHFFMEGRYKESQKAYKMAMKLDETSVAALTGIINCQLQEDKLDDAETQLDFLNEVQQSIGKSAELCFLTALLHQKKEREPDKVQKLLNEAVEIHMGAVADMSPSEEYYRLLNPDFLLTILQQLLEYAPSEPASAGMPAPPILKQATAVLEPLSRCLPGLHEAGYLTAKVLFLSGEDDGAQAALGRVIEHDVTFSEAHLLMAQIHLHQGNHQAATQSLDVGLSYNFQVRDHPIYHLIKSKCQKLNGELEGAVKTLTAAMALPGVKKPLRGPQPTKKRPVTLNDRVTVYLELADAYLSSDSQHEAAKIMQDALEEFHKTPEENRVVIVNAGLALRRGDVQGAIGTLRGIGPGKPYFVMAREKLADLYLNHVKDRRLYAACYRELVEQQPSPQTCILLGDAYMAIQEPEKAIEVYESALKKNPRDSQLASKIGRALVKTHNYGKAINYYEAALKSGNQNFLRYDLAELLLKLRQYDKAEKIITLALNDESKPQDLSGMMDETKYLHLLSQVHMKVGRLDEGVMALNRAKETQGKVLKRVAIESPEVLSQQKQLASSICKEIASHAAGQRDFEKAISLYKEALVHDPTDEDAMLEVANLLLTTNDLDACQAQCLAIMKTDFETANDAAVMMLANIMFQKNDYDGATFHFSQLLEKKADHFEALSRLVDLLRRAGRVDEIPRFLESASNKSPRVALEPGFNYCKALYEWYVGNAENALKFFNKARKDSDWGLLASYNMVEICLNPDNETIGGEVFEGAEDLHSTEKKDNEQMALRTAEKLLKEIKPKQGDLRFKLLENFALIATKEKAKVEKALAAFMEVSTAERDHVGALYGMAQAYMVLKQTPRARNQLKRVVKANWTMADGDYLEKCWLLLSDIYIQNGKFDMATELLKRCVAHNRSCCKAYEYLGYIMEKEQSYKDAAANYEAAWKTSNSSNPHIGYKLAFNYLKAKRYVDAIDVCHSVLQMHPNYPKVRKEILEKARQSIRI